MTDSIVGIVIILSSWLLMDTALKLFVNNNDAGQQVYGMWNEIQCNEIAPSSAQSATGGAVSPMVIGEPTFSETEMQNRLRQTEKYKDQLCTYARLNGIPDQCDVLFALTATESGGISSRSSEDGAVGLMQVMPDTAREMLDGKLGSAPTDAAIRTYLHTPSQNIEVGVKYYAQLYRQHNGDVTKVLAAYNGGNTALEPSAHCSGMAKWQCEWDNVEHTQPNVGYKETRDYIANITAMTEYVAGN